MNMGPLTRWFVPPNVTFSVLVSHVKKLIIKIEGVEWNLVGFLLSSQKPPKFSFSEDESGPNATDFHVNVLKRPYCPSGSEVSFVFITGTMTIIYTGYFA